MFSKKRVNQNVDDQKVCWAHISKGTVITLNIGTNRSLQIVQIQIRMHNLIRVYTVCHTYSNVLDTSRSSLEWTISKFRTSMVRR